MAYKDLDKRRAYDKAWYHKQSPEWKIRKQERAFNRRRKLQDLITSFKAHRGCLICKEDDPVVLDLHHTAKKETAIANAIKQGWSIKRIKDEIAKCIVLCANCHRRYHAGRFSLIGV